MSELLKMCEQMVKLEKLILTTKNPDLKRVMRDEYKRLSNDLKVVANKVEKVK